MSGALNLSNDKQYIGENLSAKDKV